MIENIFVWGWGFSTENHYLCAFNRRARIRMIKKTMNGIRYWVYENDVNNYFLGIRENRIERLEKLKEALDNLKDNDNGDECLHYLYQSLDSLIDYIRMEIKEGEEEAQRGAFCLPLVINRLENNIAVDIPRESIKASIGTDIFIVTPKTAKVFWEIIKINREINKSEEKIVDVPETSINMPAETYIQVITPKTEDFHRIIKFNRESHE
jgi:hypothetical protein